MPILESKQNTWTTIRSLVTAENGGVGLSATTRKWADLTATTALTAKLYPVSEFANGVCFRFRSSAGDGTTGTYFIYGVRDSDDAETACTGALTAGTQTATLGGTYADTITVTDRWNTTIKAVDAAGDNEMGKIFLDGCGVKYWLVLITVVSAGTWSVDATNW